MIVDLNHKNRGAGDRVGLRLSRGSYSDPELLNESLESCGNFLGEQKFGEYIRRAICANTLDIWTPVVGQENIFREIESGVDVITGDSMCELVARAAEMYQPKVAGEASRARILTSPSSVRLNGRYYRPQAYDFLSMAVPAECSGTLAGLVDEDGDSHLVSVVGSSGALPLFTDIFAAIAEAARAGESFLSSSAIFSDPPSIKSHSRYVDIPSAGCIYPLVNYNRGVTLGTRRQVWDGNGEFKMPDEVRITELYGSESGKTVSPSRMRYPLNETCYIDLSEPANGGFRVVYDPDSVSQYLKRRNASRRSRISRDRNDKNRSVPPNIFDDLNRLIRTYMESIPRIIFRLGKAKAIKRFGAEALAAGQKFPEERADIEDWRCMPWANYTSSCGTSVIDIKTFESRMGMLFRAMTGRNMPGPYRAMLELDAYKDSEDRYYKSYYSGGFAEALVGILYCVENKKEGTDKELLAAYAEFKKSGEWPDSFDGETLAHFYGWRDQIPKKVRDEALKRVKSKFS